MKNVPFEADALKEWFVLNQRDLPWRDQPTPYAVWVSEIMLQQTQVSVVKDYFIRWMSLFPTIEALASASLEEVIKAWEGLGYYSRARNLYLGAQYLVEHHEGKLPSTKDALAEVKGLGPYTIGAILSFAFYQREAAVDGNVIRVLARYFAIEDDIQKSQTRKQIWALAESILPRREPWIVTEGLIELGATVCTRDPKCFICPIKQGCLAYREGMQKQLPKNGKKTAITLLERDVFVIVHGREVLLKKGEEGKIMASLYEFPYRDKKEEGFLFLFPAEQLGVLPKVVHHFTRYKAELYASLWKAKQRTLIPDYDWFSWEEVQKLPFSSGHRKILKEIYAHFTH